MDEKYTVICKKQSYPPKWYTKKLMKSEKDIFYNTFNMQ